MAGIMRSIGSYFGFLTSAPPAPVPSTDTDGVVTVSMVSAPTSYVSPDVVEAYVLSGQVKLGSRNAAPAACTDFPLAGIEFNPPISSFTVSKIKSITLRAPPLPHDCNWFAGIWCTLATTGRTHTAVSLRQPSVAWVWRSNVTVPQPMEISVPWPSGRPVADSLHANLPGLHAPSLQIGLQNQPAGTASGLPAGEYVFDVLVEVEVAGRGMFGTL